MGEGGAMSMYDDLVAWQKIIDAMPRERWAHMRRDEDGHWQTLESGDAPPGWEELSKDNPFFAIARVER